MFQTLKKRIKNEKGLTLIELLAVIVILAIVAAIAVPAIGNIIAKSQDRAILAEASNILSGAKIAAVDGACGDDNICSNSELGAYVDGVTLDTTDNATYNATAKEWSITYGKLDEIKLDEYKVGTTATETAINTALKNAGGSVTTP
ncbi:prepilin-type N-terminal cleavage/methylation domain-containing protein [Metasolibacillus sp. FSL K6-0083]|uniref:prepilin-type N-terminal cleavage/methylation domain-containing protein n=1 Tax=Metasolibacillus sp. FSL K6-0083 TaxID=2921416 RepID=UPI00315A0244